MQPGPAWGKNLRAAALLLTAAATLAGAERAMPAEPGSDGAVVDVEIRGIDDPLLANVRSFLTIAELDDADTLAPLFGGEDAAEASSAEIRRRHRAAPGQIRQALMPFGYYRPRIEAELELSDSGFTASYRIDPGEPARLREVDVRLVGEGRDFPALRDALDDLALAPGDRVDHREYEAAKQRLFGTAYDGGFLDATWQASALRISVDRQHADVELTLDTGPRYYFGATDVRQDALSDDFVNRFVNIRPGEPYQVQRLLDLQRRLNETGYFTRVEVQAPRSAAGADRRIPVTVRTEPAPPQKYSLGLGYGTDTGPRGTLGVLLRRINARGHRLRADVQVSAIEQAVGARYEIPIRDYATDTLSFSATGRREEIGDADVDQIALGVSQSVGWLGFRRRLYLQAEREQFDFGGPSVQTDLVYPGVTLTRERADDLQYPRRGYRLQADLRGGWEGLLSEVSFSRLELVARWARGIAPRTRVLLRAEAGVLWTDDFDLLPPSQRFFTGGDRSIRGYAYRDVGPRNDDGDVIGGERMVAGSVELEHLFHGNYGAAVFADAGDAFDGSPDLALSAGAGFRWRSPIGMLRLDVAHPFDDEDDYRIHLTIGTAL